MSAPEDDDVDASYREAFSGLFGETPEESPAPREQSASEKTSQVPDETSPVSEDVAPLSGAASPVAEEISPISEETSSSVTGSLSPSESGEVKFRDTAESGKHSAVTPEAAAASLTDSEVLTSSTADAVALPQSDAPDETAEEAEPAEEDNGSTTLDMNSSWLDLAAAEEAEEETTASIERPKTFLDDAQGRNSRASFAIDPSMVDPELPALPPAMFVPGEGLKAEAPEPGEGAFEPGGETRIMEAGALKSEEDLGHDGEETTRAMSESDVDDVLRDMEQRVRDLHAASPHDTSEDLVLKQPLMSTGADLRPPEVPESPASTAQLLETWIRKNAGSGVHFEPVGTIEPPRPSVRLGAALEIGRTHVRYLEIQPYESGRQVATRYETIALAEPTGPDVDERLPRITAALAALRQRLGDKMAPCTVLHEQGAIGTRVLTMPVGTRAIDGAVKAALTSNEQLVSDKRVMGKVRVGTDSIKSVLVSYAPAAEVARIEEALRLTGTPASRITSSQVAFLETVVTQSARFDEDAAEAFVFIERTSVTVALAARAVLLLARVIRLEQETGTPEWVSEILEILKRESNDLERACGGGELARIRYCVALPAEIEFPTKEIVVSFGRPAEVIDIELLFRIDLDSVKQLGIPADAISILAPAAYEGTLDRGGSLDLGAGKPNPTVLAAAWALVAALLLLVVGAAVAWEPAHDKLEALRDERATLDAAVLRDERVSSEHAAALELRTARANVDKERAAVDAFAARAVEPAALLRELAPLRPSGVFYERFHAVRTDPKRLTWDLEVAAVGVGDKERGPALVGELVLRLRQGSLTDLTTRPQAPNAPDESPITVGARSGGVR